MEQRKLICRSVSYNKKCLKLIQETKNIYLCEKTVKRLSLYKFSKGGNGRWQRKREYQKFIDDAVVIHGVGVVENEKGRYMSMPITSWKTAKGEEVTRPVCHPISSSARKELEEALFSAYEQEINKNN